MKERILEILLKQVGTTISGAKLAEELGISRVMIHKYIEGLRRDGFSITAQEGRGYLLSWPKGEVNPAVVTSMIKGSFGSMLLWSSEVTSTQDELLSLLNDGKAVNGQVLVARRQLSGRGRRGRGWVAEPGGLWFSLFIVTELPMLEIPRLSLVFSLALVKVLQGWCPQVTIKWPNDLMVEGKKLGGLLLNLQGEANDVSCLVVGVGINVNCEPPILDKTSQQSATSLKYIGGEIIPIDELFVAILQSMESLYNSYCNGGWDNIISEYRHYCNHLGQTITVHQGQEKITGINTAITADGSLELITAGTRLVLHSGDIL